MATARTKSDALGFYASDPAGLGGIRADQEINPLEFVVDNPIGPIIVQHITGGNDTGTGQIRAATTAQLAYTAPGDAEGAAVTVSANTSVLLESDTPAMAVRVYRDSVYSPANLGGVMALDVYPQMNNVIAGPNADENGGDYYGCFYITNHSDANVTSVTVSPAVLGTQRVSNGGQLSGSGAGTITTTGSLADWPDSGWCIVRTSAAAVREVVYYTSRTSTALTVPAAGRGLLGTSADAGANDDTITPIAPVRVWLEAPALGVVQTIADNETEPSSPTWSFSETVATLTPGDERAVWIHREVPAGCTVNTEQLSGLTVVFTYGGTEYTHALPGQFRIGDTTLEQYELYNGEDAAPDFDAAPLETSATLPFSEPLTVSVVNYYAVRYRNRYNLTSLNILTEARELDGAGEDITNDLTDPEVVDIDSVSGGEVAIILRYNGTADTVRADYFRLYVTDDGTTPDPGTDTPTDYEMQPTALAPQTNTRRIVIGQYAYGTVVKVIARVYSSTLDDESTSLIVTTETVDTQAPVMPNWMMRSSGGYVGYSPQGYDSTTYYNAPTNTVGIRIKNGETILFGAAEAFRGVLGNSGEFRVGLEFANVAHSAAGTASPIEVVDANTFYVNVGGTRRAKVDLSVPRIEAASFDFSADAIALPVIGPTYTTATETYIQIFNGITGRWTPIIRVDSSGVFTVTQPVLQEVA